MTEEKNFEMNEINEQALEETAGGSKNYDYIHDLSRFIVRHVHGVVHYDSTSCLTMRKSPNGEVIYGYGWQNGDEILVHGSYTEGGWLFAYQRGKYGYVNPNYVSIHKTADMMQVNLYKADPAQIHKTRIQI